MNAIQFYYSINFYANITQHTRFYYQEVSKAMNDAIDKKIDSITDTVKTNELSGIDRIQKYRDELYTLLKTSSTAATNVGAYNDNVYINHVNYPTDYRTFVALTVTVNGNTTYARETNYNKRGPLLECSFRKPTNKKPYCLEDSTGLLIYKGDSTSISVCKLDYIKHPVEFNMGLESDLISAGVGVLAINTTYIATEESVYNSIKYKIGDEFTTNGVLTTLASGQVILKSKTTTTDLPEKCHDELAKSAAAILLGITGDFNESAFAEKEKS
jgi:hypothetical protein